MVIIKKNSLVLQLLEASAIKLTLCQTVFEVRVAALKLVEDEKSLSSSRSLPGLVESPYPPEIGSVNPQCLWLTANGWGERDSEVANHYNGFGT